MGSRNMNTPVLSASDIELRIENATQQNLNKLENLLPGPLFQMLNKYWLFLIIA